MTTEFYFLSRHDADPAMLQAISNKFGIDLPKNPKDLKFQFKGTISNVKKASNNQISFTEILVIEEGQEKKEVKNNHSIPSNAVIVLVGPITLQQDFLNAGATALAIPQTLRDATPDGKVIFKYSGLLHIKEIIIVSEQWDGAGKDLAQNVKERSLAS